MSLSLSIVVIRIDAGRKGKRKRENRQAWCVCALRKTDVSEPMCLQSKERLSSAMLKKITKQHSKKERNEHRATVTTSPGVGSQKTAERKKGFVV